MSHLDRALCHQLSPKEGRLIANQLFNPGRAGFLSASLTWPAGTWVPYVIGSWAFNADAVFLSDIPAAVWRARGTYLTTKTAASGIADADDTTIGAVGSSGSATGVALVLVSETGASNTSLVGAYIDTASVLPFLPNGGDVLVAWDNGANRIFKL